MRYSVKADERWLIILVWLLSRGCHNWCCAGTAICSPLRSHKCFQQPQDHEDAVAVIVIVIDNPETCSGKNLPF